MRYSSTRATLSFVAALLLGAVPADAQVVATVRIPLSATKQFAEDACKVTSKRIPITSLTGVVDTLHINIEDDQNKPSKVSSSLSVRIAAASATIAKDSTGIIVKGAAANDLAGKTLTIRRDSVIVCSVLVPVVAEELPQDSISRGFALASGQASIFYPARVPPICTMTSRYSNQTCGS